MGHRRLASVVARPAAGGEAFAVRVTWRDATSVEVDLRVATDDDPAAVLAALAAALRNAHADGAEYAVAHVGGDDDVSIRCLLRVGFEPELAGPGDEATWNRLLGQESRRSGLL
ncbi:MAG TPA: hypothetical protein VGI86_00210 [Acidimicrobiia bacterium]|jgi:acetylornithine deacetylase/succinyl-diaminopimelate desuccinylase-like protein